MLGAWVRSVVAESIATLYALRVVIEKVIRNSDL